MFFVIVSFFRTYTHTNSRAIRANAYATYACRQQQHIHQSSLRMHLPQTQTAYTECKHRQFSWLFISLINRIEFHVRSAMKGRTTTTTKEKKARSIWMKNNNNTLHSHTQQTLNKNSTITSVDSSGFICSVCAVLTPHVSTQCVLVSTLGPTDDRFTTFYAHSESHVHIDALLNSNWMHRSGIETRNVSLFSVFASIFFLFSVLWRRLSRTLVRVCCSSPHRERECDEGGVWLLLCVVWMMGMAHRTRHSVNVCTWMSDNNSSSSSSRGNSQQQQKQSTWHWLPDTNTKRMEDSVQ